MHENTIKTSIENEINFLLKKFRDNLNNNSHINETKKFMFWKTVQTSLPFYAESYIHMYIDNYQDIFNENIKDFIDKDSYDKKILLWFNKILNKNNIHEKDFNKFTKIKFEVDYTPDFKNYGFKSFDTHDLIDEFMFKTKRNNIRKQVIKAIYDVSKLLNFETEVIEIYPHYSSNNVLKALTIFAKHEC